jgi:hypothetical protein
MINQKYLITTLSIFLIDGAYFVILFPRGEGVTIIIQPIFFQFFFFFFEMHLNIIFHLIKASRLFPYCLICVDNHLPHFALHFIIFPASPELYGNFATPPDPSSLSPVQNKKYITAAPFGDANPAKPNCLWVRQ